MNYSELASKYKLMVSQDKQYEATIMILLEFGYKIAALTDIKDPSSFERAYNLVNRRGNRFIKKYHLDDDIPKDFVLTYLRNKGRKTDNNKEK